ncbi:hypothetical protein [Nocardioides lianchengensis]|uniref:Glycosyl hydrolases family 25 n=1 Tax=Nocardioides lianchengensis TaxID=1045774 RepID=A0A1G6YIR7_9ACTN|nr:hypothetical protein [Nocardioides lianchengensis]NYG09652.1 hypothetical protein [Nocardioides lianchengensis]SDD89525.1 hypothetical protein SAMN05421872_11241 [Nocardioides lianchengensis]
MTVAALLLAGCASDGSSSSSAPEAVVPPSARPTSVVEPVQDEQTSRLRALAELAEQQAAALPSASATPTARAAGEPVLGADASWPQCPKGMGIPERPTQGSPMPLPEAEYVILGLTNGPGFTENPCLADQVAWVRERGLLAAAYAVASLPDAAQVAEHGTDGPYDGGTDLGALANAGYQQAIANVATIRRAGLGSPVVWVDVEPVPDFDWGSDLEANGAVVEGAVRAYADAGYEVGVYSTPALWKGVVGDLALGLPEWRAAGQTSRAEALDRCGPDWSIQGGAPVLGQWVEAGRDQNVTCPGIETDLGRWFHQY